MPLRGSTFLLVLLITVMAHQQAHRRNYTASCVIAGLGWALLIMDVLEVFCE